MRYLLVFISCSMTVWIYVFPVSGEFQVQHQPPAEINSFGGSIFPAKPNQHLRLDLMLVTIKLKRYSYLADAVFHLFNTGDTSSIMVGIPKYGIIRDYGEHPKLCEFLRFSAWVDGREAEFSEVGHFMSDPDAMPIWGPFDLIGRPERRWMVKEISFRTEKTTVIRVKYEAKYHAYVPKSGDMTPHDIGLFFCSAARYWKGTIRKAAFVVDESDIGSEGLIINAVSSSPRHITGHVQRYEMRNYVPPTDNSPTFAGTGLAGMNKARGIWMPN